MEKETQLQFDLQDAKQEPSQEEMIGLLSQTIIKQNEQIKQAEEALTKTKEELALAMKEISVLREKLLEPIKIEPLNEQNIIISYLKNEMLYAETKVKELRHHLADYPEDGYSQVDLQNCLLHINYLKAALRRINMY